MRIRAPRRAVSGDGNDDRAGGNAMVDLVKNALGHWLGIMVASGLITSWFIL